MMHTEENAVPRRGCLSVIGRGLKWLIILLALLIAAGVIYQTVMTDQDRRTYAAPGQIVTVDGHAMHVNCIGEGSPTVILEAGAFGFSAEWYWVQQQLAATNRVCAYDRAGMGWSAPGPYPRTLLQGVMELHTLLQSAGISSPYVLVGHSYGGIRNRVYATQYPDEVSGLVMVDTALNTIHFQNADEYTQWKRDNDLLNAPVWALVRTGLARLINPGTYQGYGYPPEVANIIAAFRSSNQAFDTYYAEGIAVMAEISQEADAARDLGDMPMIVLWASVLPRALTPDETQKLAEFHQEVADYSSNSVTRTIEGADHGSIIGNEAYAQQVGVAIREVIAAAISGQPLNG